MFLDIHPENPQENKLKEVVSLLEKGGVIIYPTDTVYALGCNLYDRKAIEKILRIKKLKAEKANLSIICHDLSHISNYTLPINNSTFKLMKRTLPGPYTFLLNANREVPKIFMNKKKVIGIRVPNHNIPREIVRLLGNPIVTTSILDEDEILEYTTDPELIYEKYQSSVDAVINGGFGDNEASTIIDCTKEVPEIIREGKGSIEGLL